ncbi:hypothetical protein DFJ74DRAFT_186523 [Hyaloraphidium curvatum]|nr:hypothetical protein DFJ74DRAFT_186523 [Hyaloraphidium curvatum]
MELPGGLAAATPSLLPLAPSGALPAAPAAAPRPKSKSSGRQRDRERERERRRNRALAAAGPPKKPDPAPRNRSGGSKKRKEPGADFALPPDPAVARDKALQQNHDYQLVLSALNALRGQRQQAERDIPRLHAQKEAALADPTKFIAALMSKTNDPVPKRQKVVRVPDVSFEKYGFRMETNGGLATPRAGGVQSPIEPFKAAPYLEEAMKAIRPPPSPNGRTLWLPKGLSTFDRLAGTAFRNGISLNDSYMDSPGGSSVSRRSDSPISVHPLLPHGPILEAPPPPRSAARVSGSIYQQRQTLANQIHLAAPKSLHSGNEHPHVNGDHANGPNGDATSRPAAPAKAAGPRKSEPRRAPANIDDESVHYNVACDGCGMDPIVGIRLSCTDCAAMKIDVDLCVGCENKKFPHKHHLPTHSFRKIAIPEHVVSDFPVLPQVAV